MQLLKLLQAALWIAIRKSAHRFGVAVVLLQGKRLAGRHRTKPPIYAVDRSAYALVRGISPSAAAKTAAGEFIQILITVHPRNGYGIAVAQRFRKSGYWRYAKHYRKRQQPGNKSLIFFVLHCVSLLFLVLFIWCIYEKANHFFAVRLVIFY